MNLEVLKILVAQDESENIEFKETTNSRSLKEGGGALCGFLNNSGSSLFFRVSSKRNIIGQEVLERTTKEITKNVIL